MKLIRKELLSILLTAVIVSRETPGVSCRMLPIVSRMSIILAWNSSLVVISGLRSLVGYGSVVQR